MTSETKELNDLSLLIENEIHSTHSISDGAYMKIKQVVEAVEHINEPFDVRDRRVKSVMNLNPLAFKLFQYFVSALDNVLPETRSKVLYHASNVVLIKAFKFFPQYPEIFIAYAIRRIINDRDDFLKECMCDKAVNADNKSTRSGNMLAFIMFVLIIAVIITVIGSMQKKKLINAIKTSHKYDNDRYFLGSVGKHDKKELKKQFKEELKEFKKSLKQKYKTDE